MLGLEPGRCVHVSGTTLRFWGPAACTERPLTATKEPLGATEPGSSKGTTRTQLPRWGKRPPPVAGHGQRSRLPRRMAAPSRHQPLQNRHYRGRILNSRRKQHHGLSRAREQRLAAPTDKPAGPDGAGDRVWAIAPSADKLPLRRVVTREKSSAGEFFAGWLVDWWGR